MGNKSETNFSLANMSSGTELLKLLKRIWPKQFQVSGDGFTSKYKYMQLSLCLKE